MLAEPLLREERSGRAQGVNTSNIENDPESVDCCALILAVHNQKINTTPPFNLTLEHPTTGLERHEGFRHKRIIHLVPKPNGRALSLLEPTLPQALIISRKPLLRKT